MLDIIITTYNRVQLLEQTIAAVLKLTRLPYRLWVIDDASTDGTQTYLANLNHGQLEYAALGKKRGGVVQQFNMVWNMVDYLDMFAGAFPYLCYLQDDGQPQEDGWDKTLIAAYEDLRDAWNVGFFSGYDAKEHPLDARSDWQGREIYIKHSTSATCLIAHKDFWHRIGWVPRYNPDGSDRGYPHKNRGSHIDVYLTGCPSGGRLNPHASAVNSSFRQGKKILVIPGLIKHLAMRTNSTWRSAL